MVGQGAPAGPVSMQGEKNSSASRRPGCPANFAAAVPSSFQESLCRASSREETVVHLVRKVQVGRSRWAQGRKEEDFALGEYGFLEEDGFQEVAPRN